MNKKGFSLVTFLIVMICIAFVGFIVYLKFNAIKLAILGEDVSTEQKTGDFLINEEVSLTGILQETDDLLNYSHYVVDNKDRKIYLTSRDYNLFEYTGSYLIKGEIKEYFQDTPVLQVSSLTKIKEKAHPEINTGADIESGEQLKGYNFPELGLWFNTEFAEKYRLVEQESHKIVFQKTGSDTAFTLEYFTCSKDEASSNCEEIIKTLEESSEKDLVNPITLKFYKFSELNSWFFSALGKGYYINNLDENLIGEVANNIYVNNDYYIKNEILPNINKYCSDDEVILSRYDDYKIDQDGATTFVTLNYNAKDTGKVFCKLELAGNKVLIRKFDYKPYEEVDQAKKEGKGNDQEIENSQEKEYNNQDEKDINEKENNNVDQEKKNPEKEKKSFDTSVTQFSINPSKSLTFNSARGHKIVFPSPNIAYQEISTSYDFDQKGVHCFAVVNVVKYANEDQVDSNPDLQVYECTVNNDFDATAKDIIYKTLGDRHFVIKVNNPAWYEFANNVDIEERS